jgi:ribose 5-phosphate isomerase A
MPDPRVDPALDAAAAQAVALIPDGARVGLGTGRAAAAFITRLGVRRREGWRVTGVATSRATAEQARKAGVPLIELKENVQLDITVDGADEVAPNLDLVKGWGAALVRERIVAAVSKRQIILVTQQKLVQELGERGRVPVEVIPFARWPVAQRVRALGLVPTLRMDPGGLQPLVTENGNVILDCAPEGSLGGPTAARALEQSLLAIAGVVDTGLFLGTAEQVLVGYPDGRVDVLQRMVF